MKYKNILKMQFPISHLEAETPFGLVHLYVPDLLQNAHHL